MTFANTLQGLTQVYRVIHTTADLVSTAMTMQSGVLLVNKKSIEKATLADELREKQVESTYTKLKNRDASDVYQEELEQSGQALTGLSHITQKNTDVIKQNVAAINEQTKAYLIARAARGKYSDELANELMASADNVFKSGEDIKNIKKINIDPKKSIEKGMEYKNPYELFELPDGTQSLLEPTEDEIKKAKNRAKKLQKQKEMAQEVNNNLNKVENSAENAGEAIKEGLGNTKNSKLGGGILSPLKTELKQIGDFLIALPMPAKIAAVAIAAVGIAVYAIYKQSIKEQEEINRMKEGAEELKKKAAGLQTQINEISDSLNQYKEALNTFKGLAFETNAWADALKNVNEQGLQILQQYPELLRMKDLYKRGNNNELILNTDLIEEYINGLETQKTQQEIGSLTLGAAAEKRQSNLNIKKAESAFENRYAESSYSGLGVTKGSSLTDQSLNTKTILNQMYKDLGGVQGIGQLSDDELKKEINQWWDKNLQKTDKVTPLADNAIITDKDYQAEKNKITNSFLNS